MARPLQYIYKVRRLECWYPSDEVCERSESYTKGWNSLMRRGSEGQARTGVQPARSPAKLMEPRKGAIDGKNKKTGVGLQWSPTRYSPWIYHGGS